MCDIWFTKTDNPNPGGYKAYMPVDITDDWVWETSAERHRFHVVRLPGISRDDPRVRKYLEPHYKDGPEAKPEILERRRWRLRGNDLPQEIKDKANSNGMVKVKPKDFTGTFDYQWSDVKHFMRDFKTGLNETEDL